MSTTFDVRVWDLRKRTRGDRAGVRYEVRWTVDGANKSRTFDKKAQADAFRASIRSAADRGEPFSISSGLPASISKASGPTLLTVAREHVKATWADHSAADRKSRVEVYSHALGMFVSNKRTAPAELTEALRHEFESKDLTPVLTNAIRWLEGASLPVDSIDDEKVRTVLEQLSVRPDGAAYAASYVNKRRRYLSGLFQYATDRKYISANPVRLVKVQRAKKATQKVTRRTIGNIGVARSILANVKDPAYKTYFLVILLAGCRPSEVAALTTADLVLPEEGWGELHVRKSRAAVGRAYTDSGARRDSRGLKHREDGDERTVPIPPELVKALREHRGDRKGLLFPGTVPGQPVSDSAVSEAWKKARELTLEEDDPTLDGLYSLRHLCASTWLNAGVPAVEAASRLGHSPAMLLNVYGHLIDIDRGRWNSVIEQAIV